MILETRTPLDAALRQGYEGRAVELVKGYAHRATLLKMRSIINDRVKLISGPLYKGEAEHLLLFPLCEAVRAAQVNASGAEVAAHAYQLAAAYALIFDISKISQSKDIANQLTLGSIAAQPIVKAFLQKTDRQISNDTAYKEQLLTIWQAITFMATDNVLYTPSRYDKHKTTPLSLLYEATSTKFVKTDLEKDTVGVWDQLLSHLRHGKGTPLDKEGRRAMMATLSELLLRIDQLIEDAQKADRASAGDGAEISTAYVDAYTAMYWLLIYLDAIDQYDVIFPATDLMVQSQAWVLVIKTQSAKLKKLFVDIAQVAAAYDIFTAIRSWEEVRTFYNPVLNSSLSAVADMDSLWQDCKNRAAKMLSSYAKDQVDTMFDSFKSYMKADYLLPESDFQMASDVLAIYAAPIPNGEGFYLAKHGQELLTQIDSVGERQISVLDRDLLIPGLASSASAVEAAIAYIKRSREMMQLSEETDDIYHALLPDGVRWTNPYALSGEVTQMTPAGFTFTDPMQLAYEKYQVTPENKGNISTIASLDWSFTKLVMQPFYRIPQLQSFARQRSPESRVLWPGMGELPVGDIITAEYVAQPVPACYTASRNANFVNNDFSAYLTLMSGRSGVTSSSRDMFRKLAAILDRYEDTYGRGILDALAACMFVYRAKDGDHWEQLHPSTPTIYGMPLQAMLDANAIKLSAATDEAILKRSIRVKLESGSAYQFVLHAKMPKPGPMTYFAYPYAKGVYLHIPLLKSVFEQNADRIAAALHINFAKADNASGAEGYFLDDLIELIRGMKNKTELGGASFISTLGWAPYLVNLPHMLCSYQDEEDVLLSEEYQKYAMLSVRVRYDAIERSIYVGGFIDNPVELINVGDYEKAATEEDPSPLPKSATSVVEGENPDVKEPERATAESRPDPKTLGPTPKDAAGNALEDKQRAVIASVTGAPIIKDDKVVIPTGEEEKDKVGTKKVDSDALAGDVEPTQEEPVHSEGDDSGRDSELYWKKISSDGSIEDVVKAKTCPSGYVPASIDEFRSFVEKVSKHEQQPSE